MKSLRAVKSDYLNDTDGVDASDTIYSGMLAANTEQTVTVPTGADFCIFMCRSDFYTNYDTTATVPTGTISQAGGELKPYLVYIGTTSVIHLISDTGGKITMSFFSV